LVKERVIKHVAVVDAG